MQLPSIQSRPLSLRLCHFWSPKRLWEINDSLRTTMSSSTCGTGSQHSPGNFTRQPFTALCLSGTSASTARANTSDIQVLVSISTPLAHFFFNAPHKNHHLSRKETLIPSGHSSDIELSNNYIIISEWTYSNWSNVKRNLYPTQSVDRAPSMTSATSVDLTICWKMFNGMLFFLFILLCFMR